MARKWCGFLAQNQVTKEEWDLLEACMAQAYWADQPEDNPPEPPAAPSRDSRSARLSRPAKRLVR